MKGFLIALLALTAVSVASLRLGGYIQAQQKTRRMDIAESAYSTGCYFEALQACSWIQSDIDRGNCLDQADHICPVRASAFRSWLEGGK